jgi:hypothetical protein
MRSAQGPHASVSTHAPGYSLSTFSDSANPWPPCTLGAQHDSRPRPLLLLPGYVRTPPPPTHTHDTTTPTPLTHTSFLLRPLHDVPALTWLGPMRHEPTPTLTACCTPPAAPARCTRLLHPPVAARHACPHRHPCSPPPSPLVWWPRRQALCCGRESPRRPHAPLRHDRWGSNLSPHPPAPSSISCRPW